MSIKIEKNDLDSKARYRALEDFVILLINFATHDIKNSVHNLDGVINNFDVDEKYQSDIDSIKVCIGSIRGALENFKNLGEGKIVDSFVLSTLIKSIELLHRNYISVHKVKYTVDLIGTQSDLVIYQTFHGVLQILNNLFMNAQSALSESENKSILLSIKTIGDKISFTVSDSGVGIPSQNKEKIFNPYFTTKQGGSGVGLTHVKHVVESMKGTAELINSIDGYVTSVNIVFPIKNKHETFNINN